MGKKRELLKGDWGREGKRRSELTSVESSGRQPLRDQNWLIYCSLPQILDINLLVYAFIFTFATIRVRETRYKNKILLISFLKKCKEGFPAEPRV